MLSTTSAYIRPSSPPQTDVVDAGGPSYDPNAANANFGTMSAASTPPTASPHPGNLGWGVDPQWGFGTPGSGGMGFGPGVVTGSPGAGSGFTLSQVLSGGDMPAVGKKK